MKYVVAPSGKAVYREGMGGRRVRFDAMLALPFVHKTHLVDTSISNLSLTFLGPENPLITRDEQLFDLKVTFYLRINGAIQDVFDAVDHFGVENLAELDDRIPEMINDAEQLIRSTAGELTWQQVGDTPTFIDAIIQRLPGGFFKPGVLVDDVALDHVDKFPPEISAGQGASLLFREQ